jgi:protein subunit release factor A
MSTIILEVRSAEGGEDSKLLVQDQVTIYNKFFSRRGL